MLGDYTCKLNPESLAKAKKELNEDPSNRLGAVQTLREWIERQPHITCNTGKVYLLYERSLKVLLKDVMYMPRMS